MTEETKGSREVAAKPHCFGWHDEADPPCRKCAVRAECIAKQHKVRPECFGELYDSSHPECKACLDNSQCIEAMEDGEMATKVRIKRTVTAPVAEELEEEAVVEAPVDEVEPVEEATDDVEAPTEADEASPYDELGLAELREELAGRKLDASGRKSQLIERLIEDDAKPKAKPVVKQVVKAAEPAKPIAKAGPVPTVSQATQSVQTKQVVKPVAPVKPVPIAQAKADEPMVTFAVKAHIAEILDAMDKGKTIKITKVTDTDWIMSLSGMQPVAPLAQAKPEAKPEKKAKGLRGDDYDREVMTQEY